MSEFNQKSDVINTEKSIKINDQMMLVELSDINVDDNDLPVEMSDNILCS